MNNSSQKSIALDTLLKSLVDLVKLRAIDCAFADFIYQQEQCLSEQDKISVAMLAAYISFSTGEQHTCIDLNELQTLNLKGYQFPDKHALLELLSQANTVLCIPSHTQICTKLAKPLVVQNGKVYLQRYWQYEVELAAIIRNKADKYREVDWSAARTILADLFDDSSNIATSLLDWQKIAVCLSACQSLSVISGGPGTGKTTTVTKLLALLQGLAGKQNRILNIQLAAPTGKAAARLTESISAAKKRLAPHLQMHLPEQCQTIHRLLGAKPLSPYFKANSNNPLHLDVLVLDEASMVDLPLMAKLFSSLPEDAQVILLGDQYQLASVETGSVLSDMCLQGEVSSELDAAILARYSPELMAKLTLLIDDLPVPNTDYLLPKTSVIADNLVNLLKSHRFSDDSGIGQLAKAIKLGAQTSVQALLKERAFDDIHWYQISSNAAANTQSLVAEQILKQLISKLLPIFKLYATAVKQGDIRLAFNCLQQQQVLCAQKSGFWGVEQINALIESELDKQGLIDKHRDFYAGRPVMLSKNDHQLKLFNGDIGIVMPDPQSPSLMKVWFLTPEGEVRGLLPSRLPSHETLYAMTIHKSQGSEFESVYLCLPLLKGNNGGRGLNRELLYTGLTRAKKHFTLFAQPQALALSLAQQCIRSSGLADRLSTKSTA
ncbi:exodeoxyribonuclease V subunit alpha [Paraglaciecola sp. L3A3]|uniref:exodeoxyribonuclease V subunit alpha n=1 Tax=Paraglaciecola sp. L3A3 TaxID=2686358 RepID=UPI001E3B24F7|nr:exodeoxyribonuclease V subunit alpha [Paraglaciecola sp. L3A3]